MIRLLSDADDTLGSPVSLRSVPALPLPRWRMLDAAESPSCLAGPSCDDDRGPWSSWIGTPPPGWKPGMTSPCLACGAGCGELHRVIIGGVTTRADVAPPFPQAVCPHGDDGECGFTRAGMGWTCREGRACGHHVAPSERFHAELTAFDRAARRPAPAVCGDRYDPGQGSTLPPHRRGQLMWAREGEELPALDAEATAPPVFQPVPPERWRLLGVS